ncbi:MAG TPA: hypothetical protein VIL37_12975 [Natronosporangium sp.]
MPHVELSLIEDPNRLRANLPSEPGRVPSARQAPAPAYASSLDRWASVVTSAVEPSLVLASDATIVAVSASCAEMIGITDPETAHGRRLREAGVQLVDFTSSLAELDPSEADKIPPLLAISSRRLARGLLRVAHPGTRSARTIDAIATPLWDGVTVVGSLTFFSQI